ncbi:MAG: hypothetical protein V2G33_03890 [bacterium JZ-2024 1]
MEINWKLIIILAVIALVLVGLYVWFYGGKVEVEQIRGLGGATQGGMILFGLH